MQKYVPLLLSFPVVVLTACSLAPIAVSQQPEVAASPTPPAPTDTADTNPWIMLGPWGGVTNIAIDPLTPTTLYAGINGEGRFKSTNGGENWNAVNTGLTNTQIRALAIHPQNPAILYAGTNEGGIFKSENSGENWIAVNTGLPCPYVYTLMIDPATPTTLYTGTLCGMFKSIDAGGNWNAINSGLPATFIFALAIDPLTPTTLYAGTEAAAPRRRTPSRLTYPAKAFLKALTAERIGSQPITACPSMPVFIRWPSTLLPQLPCTPGYRSGEPAYIKVRMGAGIGAK